MHGEHPRARKSRVAAQGSSPYARGAQAALVVCDGLVGIIPVCTGSTQRGSRLHHGPSDHPRMHGEHLVSSTSTVRSVGSSPYARGAPPQGRPPPIRPGIIPVCTGSTGGEARIESKHGDHPRMHGEHEAPRAEQRSGPGSSPYARGARVMPSVCRLPGGIIPVCTGSTGS